MTIQIDENDGHLLKYPADGIIQSARIEGREIVVQLDTPDEHNGLNIGLVTDGAGNDITGHKQSFRSSEGLERKEVRIEFQPEKVTKGPIQMEIGGYPLTHKQQVKLQIK